MNMKVLHSRTLQLALFFLLAATLPAVAQDNQQGQQQKPQPHAGQQQGRPQHGGQKPETKPAPNHGTRPQPNRPNPGNNRPAQPSRPNPGNNRPSHPPRPNPGGNRPNPSPRPPSHRPPAHRPPQWGRPPAHRGSYRFRSNDRAYLLRYYGSRGRVIQGGSRPVVVVGGYFPYAYINYLSPLPADLYGYVPPPPPGYQIGYCDGYVVVYDPLTFYIVAVIDLW